MVETALEIACIAHRGQVDKQGKPYILHPIAVMETTRKILRNQGVPEYLTEEDFLATALLHDVVEDSSWTLGDLEKWGIPYSVVQAVERLTRDENTEYIDYVKNACRNDIARIVKLADLQHNLDESRGPISDSLRAKYEKAKKIVEDSILNDRSVA